MSVIEAEGAESKGIWETESGGTPRTFKAAPIRRFLFIHLILIPQHYILL